MTPRLWVRWGARGHPRQQVVEVLDYRTTVLLGRQALVVGRGGCPLWAGLHELEVSDSTEDDTLIPVLPWAIHPPKP